MPQPESHSPRPENRLGQSTSPYLLQHRMNPVDWYPWGPEAFDAARRRDVPIFLSIGYSTCYWCHVMERESFENDAIAAQMNCDFVCVKVDREERPDVDDIYMAAVQAFRGQGGWPMSVFLEPKSLKPFWAGTYFPAEPKFANMPTFPQILQAIAAAWKQERDDIVQQAEKLADAVRERVCESATPVQLGVHQVTQAVSQLLKLHDPVHGGFGSAPKFPQPVYLELLLEVRGNAAEETRAAIDAAIRSTFDQMAIGGIFDQVGGGFHRYSVDATWTVPHFEKMLYDNAQLAAVYAQAAAEFGDALYRRTAVRTLDYVLREMTSPTSGRSGRGEFYSAQDAEVNHREGQNYLWNQQEVRKVLEQADSELVGRIYSLDSGPNFRDPHHQSDPPTNVLRWPAKPGSVATGLGIPESELLVRVDRLNHKLYASRQLRDQPSTDTKTLAAWNGLMIASMARAGVLLEEPRFVAAARAAATSLLETHDDGRGGILRTAGVPGFLEDYACMAQGCMELHRAGGDDSSKWLAEAQRLVAAAETRFGDPLSGGFYDTLAHQPDLFVRSRSSYDGAMPCGASVMLNVLVDLFEVTAKREYLDRALRALRAGSAYTASAPLGAAGSTRALLRLLVLEPGATSAAFAEDGASSPAPAEDFTAVEVHAAVERIVIAPGEPVPITLRFQIAPGYHINAADPGSGPDAADLVPLRVHILNGTGVEVYADYPPGIPSGQGGLLRVISGEFELPIVLERHGDWSGTPLIGVTYQACTEDSCLQPRTVELDVAIDRRD